VWLLVVEVEDELELELELELDELEPVVVVVVGGGGGGGGGALHDSETLAIGAGTGRPSADTGVPGAALTVKERCCPVTVVTVTTHVSADAVGISARACTESTVPTVKSATLSFRRLNTVALLLPPCWRAQLGRSHHAATEQSGRY